MRLTFPSAVSPVAPAFRLTLPAGWEERPHATAAAFAVDTRSPAGFHVNLVVLVTRVLTGDSLDELVEAAQSAPGVVAMAPHLEGRQHDTIDGHNAVLSAFTLNSPELPFPLFQAQAAVVLPGDVRHFVHCYATCPAASAERYATAFRAMFATLHFE